MSSHEELLYTLSQGIDFRTGEYFPPDHVLQNPDAVRALHAAVSAMKRNIQDKTALRSKPSNQGATWNLHEEAQLVQAFQQGKRISDIAVQHGRTGGAITSRLKKLDLIE